MSIIRFRFTGDTTSLDKASAGAKKQLKQLREEFRKGVTDSSKWAAASAAAAATIGATIVKRTLDAVDAQAKLAKSLNATTKELEVVETAAGYSGVSIDSVAQATKDLTRRLSQAAGGAGPAIEALERLDLTADQLSNMPLDDRIRTINEAINEFIPAAEQAAVAGQLFGEEGSLAMRRIDPATIEQAAKDVEDFGTALSDVQVAQIEAANDELARVGMIADGIGRQFTAELAPIINGFAKSLTDAARESDDLGTGAERAADAVIDAMGFGMDAVDGVRRTFVVAGQAAATFALAVQRDALKMAQAILDFPVKATNDLITLLNSVPGVDIELMNQGRLSAAIQQEMELAAMAVQAGKDSIDETLSEPMPSVAFREFVEEARKASEEAAQATVEALSGGGEGGMPELGLTDKEREGLQARVDAIRETYASEMDLLREKFGLEQEALAEALENKLVSEDEYRQLSLEAEQSYRDESDRIVQQSEDRKAAIEKASYMRRRQALGDALANLTTLMNTESRKQFEIGKAAAIADTVISTYEGAQKAFTSLAGIPIVGPALGAAAATAAIAGGVARVNSIRSQSLGGSSTPANTPTQSVNAASTPVAQGGGTEGGGGTTTTVVNLEPDAIFTGATVARLLEEYSSDGGILKANIQGSN